MPTVGGKRLIIDSFRRAVPEKSTVRHRPRNWEDDTESGTINSLFWHSDGLLRCEAKRTSPKDETRQSRGSRRHRGKMDGALIALHPVTDQASMFLCKINNFFCQKIELIVKFCQLRHAFLAFCLRDLDLTGLLSSVIQTSLTMGKHKGSKIYFKIRLLHLRDIPIKQWVSKSTKLFIHQNLQL